MRDVQQGPDGYLYVLTEEDNGALLRIEPARAITEAPGTVIPTVRLREPRIGPLPESEWTDDQRALVTQYETEGHSPNVVRTLIRVPALAGRVFPTAHYVANESTLPPRHRGILLLRTAWLTQSANIWAHVASQAADYGLSAEEVLRAAQGAGDAWDEFDLALVGMADELFRDAAIADRTWATLAAEYDIPQLIDAVMTVGDTAQAAILYNSLGIQPDAVTPPEARIPTNDVAYRVIVPDPEPPLASPRIDPEPGDGLRVGRTFARSPGLSEARARNDRYVLEPERARLTPHDRELVILRMGWNSQAVYEWAKHVGSVGRARDHGLDPIWIAQGRDQPGWNAHELALIDAANELFRDSMIADDTWATLSATYDAHQLMSLALTGARYRMVSMALNAFGVQPRDDDERFPILEGY